MSHILVDANGAPVPLPYYGPKGDITQFFDPDPDNPFKMAGSVYVANKGEEHPSDHGLSIITEAEYMRRQETSND